MAALVAGANAALTAENPGLDHVLVGMGWDTIPSNGPQAELVPFALMCGADGRAVSNEHLVFFNQLVSADSSVTFIGDGDQEQIDVALSQVPEDITKIIFLVYVDPEFRGQGTFAAVRSAHIRVATADNRELVRFDLSAVKLETVTAMIFGELYRHRSDWKFRALGQGYSTGLAGVAKDYGIRL
ncbi:MULTISPECIES: TerD family protein [Arthrobacter]|uniref:TerD family protein n=1 Tax=unclassified Arthrobacter TaxID=235627 RepID=UPI0024B96B3C|nr:TerD family protein [Arthrobacter sp. H35-MC1]MDJ0316619.1 TerD family protein [Arthrobacter sp. H35-MC1]